nr:unnamed protein product [Callosobruchus analis]
MLNSLHHVGLSTSAVKLFTTCLCGRTQAVTIAGSKPKHSCSIALLNVIDEIFRANDEGKSSWITFEKEDIKNHFSQANLAITNNNEILERKSSVKNLWLIIDDELSFSDHTKHKLQAAYMNLKVIYQILTSAQLRNAYDPPNLHISGEYDCVTFKRSLKPYLHHTDDLRLIIIEQKSLFK